MSTDQSSSSSGSGADESHTHTAAQFVIPSMPRLARRSRQFEPERGIHAGERSSTAQRMRKPVARDLDAARSIKVTAMVSNSRVAA